MRKIPLISVSLLVFFALDSGHAQDNVKQIPGGVIAGEARIQFLSATLVRLEYSPTGRFTDLPTAIVLNRSWVPPKVKVRKDYEWITLLGEHMTVRFVSGTGKFNSSNLRVVWTVGNRRGVWSPSDSDLQNLGGINASLDGARRGRLPRQTPGILSRSGYFLLDDSNTPIWDNKQQWIVPRVQTDSGMEIQDWYFFVYGTDYKHVLKEYAELCGRIPMIPKYTLGAWATDLNYEYLPDSRMVSAYHYTDDSVRSIVTRFREYDIPLDILVLDFAWHLRGWKGSYDWSPIFPRPEEFLKWAGNQGIKVSLNDHPGYGRESVLSDDDSRAPLVKKLLGISEPTPPSVVISLLGEWKFRPDSTNRGKVEQWYSRKTEDTTWKTVTIDKPWEVQGFGGYDGVAWYRKWVRIPDTALPETLYAAFGNVDDEYDLYVNDHWVAHHSPSFNTLTATNVGRIVGRGEKILIALRVNDWGGDGGLATSTAMITDVLPREGIRFNLADKHQADVFMDVLHKPLMEEGVAFWWVDGGMGSCKMDGLNSQMWTNRVYYEFTQHQTGKRGFIFSRYGGWGSHRYPSLFTGDTYAQWDVLAFEVPFTAQGGNVLIPYITHDIGGFIGKDISLDLYVRWLQFGVFSPLLRLHSAHENPEEGNVRMPWMHGEEGIRIARDLFRLRYELLPYLYTMTRIAYDEALPVLRPLYLEHPEIEEAYHHSDEYYFGSSLLVAPIVDSSRTRDVYFPPGKWTDFFSGKTFAGGESIRVACSLDQMPVYVKEGSIITRQSAGAFVDQRLLDTLLVDIYGPGKSEFTLYEDDGLTLDYARGLCSYTPISVRKEYGGENALTIGPTSGKYEGQVSRRAYRVRIFDRPKPSSVTIDGKNLGVEGAIGKNGDSWSWVQRAHCTTIRISKTDIRRSIVVRLR
jgi:alpha-glucosidase (family GH31 glycosyl hydrolase)